VSETSQGVIYMTWGQKAIDHANTSIMSLRQFDETMPVMVVGDAEAEEQYRGRPDIAFVRIEIDPFEGARFMAGRIKPLLYGLSPWKRTLYVDADTEFEYDPRVGFGLLDKWDFVVAETQTRSLNDSIAGPAETRWTAAWLGTPWLLYHNSGVLFWRKCGAVAHLFELWSDEWQRWQDWDEQVALLRALLRSDCLYLTVPYTWNCLYSQHSTLVHHRFGTRVARKFDDRGASRKRIDKILEQKKVRVRPQPQPQPEPRKLVDVWVAPGHRVRCIEKNAEEVKRRWRDRAQQAKKR